MKNDIQIYSIGCCSKDGLYVFVCVCVCVFVYPVYQFMQHIRWFKHNNYLWYHKRFAGSQYQNNCNLLQHARTEEPARNIEAILWNLIYHQFT